METTFLWLKDFFLEPRFSFLQIAIFGLFLDMALKNKNWWKTPLPAWGRYIVYALAVAVLAFFAWALKLSSDSEKTYDSVNGVQPSESMPESYLR